MIGNVELNFIRKKEFMISEKCPVCTSISLAHDVVDFNKSCSLSSYYVLPLSGQAIYYFLCQNCGFCFAPDIRRWTKEEFAKKIYNPDYIKVDPDYLEVRPRQMYEFINSRFKQYKSEIIHLDYGGGNGTLSQFLRNNAWDSNCYDPYSNIGKHISEIDRSNLITCFEVIEHAENLDLLMRNLSSVAADESLIVISTLLSDGKINPGVRLDWWYAAPRNGHISLFSKKSLEILASNYGFNFYSADSSIHYFYKSIPNWASSFIKN